MKGENLLLSEIRKSKGKIQDHQRMRPFLLHGRNRKITMDRGRETQ